jgi:alpha,alpha-trehalase
MTNYKSPDRIYKKLFEDLHRSGHWSDVKIIGDATSKILPKKVMSAYRKAVKSKDFDLIAFAYKHFDFPESTDSSFESDTTRSPQEHIETLWEVLERKADEVVVGSSLIPLPHPYIVPGGRFNEIYYWDSYFTMLGLQVSGKVDLIESMVNNFSHLIEEVGFVPNGNRTYFLSRSQPPFFGMMVSLLAEEKGDEVLFHYLPFLEKEYRFWMKKSDAAIREGNAQLRSIAVEGENILNRYWDNLDTPRAEMLAVDLETAEGTDRESHQLFRDLRSACESGWDFSSRWLRDPNDLSSIHASEIAAVDLNCLLLHLERTLLKAYAYLDDAGYMRSYYSSQVIKRKKLILEYFWDESAGFFMDYDFVKRESKDVFSLAGMYPLFFEIATPEQAKKCAERIEKEFLKAGGVISTTLTTAQQWDAPNGWAPLQWITIKGLKNYGFDELANTIKDRWVELNTKVYKNTGKMLEKYNVVDVNLETGGGEYPVQDGFGWTNGVLLKLLSE